VYIKSKFSARAFNGPLKLALVGLTLFFVATSPSFLIAQSTSRVADPAPDTEGQLDAEKTWSLKSESQTLEAIESWVDESSGLPKDALKNAVSAFNEFVPDNAAYWRYSPVFALTSLELQANSPVNETQSYRPTLVTCWTIKANTRLSRITFVCCSVVGYPKTNFTTKRWNNLT